MGMFDWLTKKPVEIKATYEAARTGVNDRYWRNADHFDPELSASRQTRQFLVPRSRHEQQNNGYIGGNLAMQANFLVGARGPIVRLQTDNADFNREVENQWWLWAQAVKFRRKLWTVTHARYQDGDGFGVLRNNRLNNHPVKLDWVIFEQEMCQSPVLALRVPGKGDGIDYDPETGVPELYHILKYHPGGAWGMYDQPEQVPARFVIHWFKQIRPGATRGTPVNSATLNLGAQARRHRLATLTAAESAAGHTVMFETDKPPDEVAQIELNTTYEILPGMAQPTPAGWKAKQMAGEHPTAEYSEFHRQLLGESHRPLGMPVNMALGDSSQSNYASAQIDMLPWFKSLDVERADCNDLVLEPMFAQWWGEAVLRFGWPAEMPPHQHDWEAHPIIDREADSTSNDTDLGNGSVTLPAIYAKRGLDLNDELEKEAEIFGVPPEEHKKNVYGLRFAKEAAPPGAGPDGEATTNADAGSTDNAGSVGG